ncbi:hypothetical protein DdX_03362 [Ditylenchus destructor]|uniref:Uncharacterized protein n=1 Tax=Ditylenchus destructor TaxID=166010 RepID=A0AAD4NE74_9BILA|nr:hypothetical protein DdX_03362 [Ditylenchus destructor]
MKGTAQKPQGREVCIEIQHSWIFSFHEDDSSLFGCYIHSSESLLLATTTNASICLKRPNSPTPSLPLKWEMHSKANDLKSGIHDCRGLPEHLSMRPIDSAGPFPGNQGHQRAMVYRSLG